MPSRADDTFWAFSKYLLNECMNKFTLKSGYSCVCVCVCAHAHTQAHVCIHPGAILSRLLSGFVKVKCAFAFWARFYFGSFDQKENF